MENNILKLFRNPMDKKTSQWITTLVVGVARELHLCLLFLLYYIAISHQHKVSRNTRKNFEISLKSLMQKFAFHSFIEVRVRGFSSGTW